MVSDNLVDGGYCTAMRRRKGRGQGRWWVSQKHTGAHGHRGGDGRQVVASLVVVEVCECVKVGGGGSWVIGQGSSVREGLWFTFT